ncbi:hypothetical protein IV203_021322 [Nitzschia inconspicua]|uniref:Uncharacterized protein n=1 Tax=Nitzschia inconspicua TaxID=303405 RepID=A0A9K3PD66_9STRA|nr:hypothetical protein IV203_021322 [Nitzschia inconspicua]
MARGATAKLKRRNRKKEDQAETDRLFAEDLDDSNDDGNSHDFGLGDIPLPPGMAAQVKDDGGGVEEKKEAVRDDKEELTKIRKKKKKPCCDNDHDQKIPQPKKSTQGIKTTPLILLMLMVGTAVLPALIYASDFIGGLLAKNHVMGQIGFRLGMGAVPRKRVMSFYEKHDPNKLEEVPTILSKYYGDYPKLVKKLERKYQDYGYFLGWEQDEAPMTLAIEKMQETYSVWIHSYWNVYAPQSLKTAARNIRYNVTFLQKKFRKVWKKSIWPHLEPFLGVPKGAEKQKRQDAAEARKRKQATSKTSGRRRSTEFRDEEEM